MIDKTKKYRTACGYAVKIYVTDAGGDWPVHGAIQHPKSKEWVPTGWSDIGKHRHYPGDNLIEVSPRIQGWFVIRSDAGVDEAFLSSRIYKTREEALLKSADGITGPLACIHFDVEEGEGL